MTSRNSTGQVAGTKDLWCLAHVTSMSVSFARLW